MYLCRTLAALALASSLAAAAPTGVQNPIIHADQAFDIPVQRDFQAAPAFRPHPARVQPVNRAAQTPSPSGGAVPVNSGAIHLIESLEGFRSDFYYIDGDKTIGYGHDCTQRGGCDSISPPLSQADGEKLLYSDITEYESCVCGLPNASGLNANQYGALVSFTYNSGCGGVQEYFGSDMSNSDFSGICSSLPTTNTLGGELSSRRQREGDFCSTATTAMSGC